jgi:hypothetical protein
MKHTELIAKLKTDAKTKTKSEIAQAQATEKTQAQAQAQVKTRNVTDFIVKKTKEQLEKDTRQVIKERRSYMLTDLNDNESEVYNATMYRNEKNELVLLTQKIADKLVLDYVTKLQSMQKFNAQNIMTIHKTCGGAYGDKVRKFLFSISLLTTATEIEKDINSVVKKAQEKKKLCIYYNTIEDSRRIKYEFIKL